MTKQIKITIENKLVMENRDMNVYHHSSRSAHMISYDSAVTLPLRSAAEDDYLYISIVRGPGCLEGRCVIDLPSWVDFELSSAGDATIAHSGDRLLLKIPPGPPLWQLKMTQSVTALRNPSWDRVIIGDDRLTIKN